MELKRRNLAVYGLLLLVWAVVVVWQMQEHVRVRERAKTELRERCRDIARTVSACIRGMRFRGAVLEERLNPLLNELVNGRTNELSRSSELKAVVLLNATGESIASAGIPVDLDQKELVQEGERWGQHSVTLINPVDLGASLTSEGVTNTVLLPPMRERTNQMADPARPMHPGPEADPELRPIETNLFSPGQAQHPLLEMRPPGGNRPGGHPHRPPWMRGLDEAELRSLAEKRALHGLVVVMSTEPFNDVVASDLLLRSVILILASLAALGCGLAWRNVAKNAELQIRLVRASELNSHLKEMNLAAAGLAHETRNPLNIIRGLAQMISRVPHAGPEIQEKAHAVVNEADKVAGQLNEFINYSRPREVRRSSVLLSAVVNEVSRALTFDLEEKKLQLQIRGEPLTVEADEQMLRQALFNLLLNATQAVQAGGQIEVCSTRLSPTEACLEVRDDGPGVAPERREEIFKPYFTTHKQGTGLGLAVVQQIVLAHGWEIVCLANEPQGALFRISHLRLSGPGLKKR